MRKKMVSFALREGKRVLRHREIYWAMSGRCLVLALSAWGLDAFWENVFPIVREAWHPAVITVFRDAMLIGLLLIGQLYLEQAACRCYRTLSDRPDSIGESRWISDLPTLLGQDLWTLGGTLAALTSLRVATALVERESLWSTLLLLAGGLVLLGCFAAMQATLPYVWLRGEYPYMLSRDLRRASRRMMRRHRYAGLSLTLRAFLWASIAALGGTLFVIFWGLPHLLLSKAALAAALCKTDL